MNLRVSSRALLAVAGLACAVSVGLALLAQHQFNMQPCPWCILQRMIFIVLAFMCLLAAALPPSPRRLIAALALPLAASGVGAALWQHFVAAKTSSCALTLADRIVMATGLDTQFPDWFEVRATCAEAAVSVLGVPFAFWALALFAAIGLVLVLNVLNPARRA